MSGGRIHIPSRREYDTVVLDLPKADAAELPSMIRFALASHYPGNPDDLAVGWSALRTASGYRMVAYLMPKAKLEGFRERHGTVPVLPALPLVLAWIKRNPQAASTMETAVIVQDDCVEVVRFSDGVPEDSRAIPRKSRTIETGAGPDTGLSFDALRLGPEYSGKTYLFVPSEKHPDGNESTENAASNPDIVRVPFETLRAGRVSKRVGPHEYLNAPVSRRLRVPYAVRIAVLCSVLAGLCVFTAMKNLAGKEAELAALKARFASLEREYRETASETGERQRLSAMLDAVTERRPVDTYDFFSLLSLVMGADVEITSLSLSGGKFELEGTAKAPFGLVSRFEDRKDFFSDVGISRVVPLADGNRFFLTGVYHGR